ncbi:helix-turn-helix transcriptional regulator [Candidatus Uhrbacteria bacterium]|nr:helix-turn-helix transcriptional regulator [Candidatus Uhrbacteria bacterium]
MISQTDLALGILIKFIRQVTNTSQSEYATAMGVKQSTVASLEKGKALTIENLEKLSLFFGISIASLIQAAKDFLEIHENNDGLLSLACYLIGAMDTNNEEVTAKNIIRHISNYREGVRVRTKKTDLTKALIGIKEIFLSVEKAHQPSTS